MKEIGGILDELGDAEAEISKTDLSGILTVKTKLDPFEVIKKTGEQLLEEPWHIRYCLRMIPIQITTETRLEDVKKGIEEIRKDILNKDTYKIVIEKRNSSISSREWIEDIANDIPNEVSLERPDKTILIEILENKTGIAVIRGNDVLSVEKAKRSLSE